MSRSRRDEYDEPRGGSRSRRDEPDDRRGGPRPQRDALWGDEESAPGLGNRVMNALTGRSRAVGVARPGVGRAGASKTAAKGGSSQVTLTIIGVVVVLWLFGAAVGYVTHRPVHLSGAAVPAATAPAGTGTPATTGTP